MSDVIVNGLAWFVAWLFAMAGLHKLRASSYYVELLRAHTAGFLGSVWLVWILALLELGLVALLLAPATRSVGLVASVLVLLAYSGLLAVQLMRGKTDIRCGCAGPGSRLVISEQLVLRNLACAALALIALIPSDSSISGVANAGLSLFVAAFLTLLYLLSEQLISNSQDFSRTN